jgi:hypothetical protein
MAADGSVMLLFLRNPAELLDTGVLSKLVYWEVAG